MGGHPVWEVVYTAYRTVAIDESLLHIDDWFSLNNIPFSIIDLICQDQERFDKRFNVVVGTKEVLRRDKIFFADVALSDKIAREVEQAAKRVERAAKQAANKNKSKRGAGGAGGANTTKRHYDLQLKLRF